MLPCSKLEGVIKYPNLLSFDYARARLLVHGCLDASGRYILAYGKPTGVILDRTVVLPYDIYPWPLRELLVDELLPNTTGWLFACSDDYGEFFVDGKRKGTRIRFARYEPSKDSLKRRNLPELVRPSYDLFVELYELIFKILEISRPEQLNEWAICMYNLKHKGRIDCLFNAAVTEHLRCKIHLKFRDIIQPTEKLLWRGSQAVARKRKRVCAVHDI
jgi:hypothetical protein